MRICFLPNAIFIKDAESPVKIVEKVVEAVEDVTEAVEEVVEVVKETLDVVKETIEKADKVVDEVKKIEDETKEIIQESKDIISEGTQLVEDVNKVIEEGREIVTEVAGVVKEVSMCRFEEVQRWRQHTNNTRWSSMRSRRNRRKHKRSVNEPQHRLCKCGSAGVVRGVPGQCPGGRQEARARAFKRVRERGQGRVMRVFARSVVARAGAARVAMRSYSGRRAFTAPRVWAAMPDCDGRQEYGNP